MNTSPSENNDSAWLRRWRSQHGLHQHQVAAILDENQGRISEVESGRKPLKPEWRQKLSEWEVN